VFDRGLSGMRSQHRPDKYLTGGWLGLACWLRAAVRMGCCQAPGRLQCPGMLPRELQEDVGLHGLHMDDRQMLRLGEVLGKLRKASDLRCLVLLFRLLSASW
jgi:hypothetical protein